MARLLKLHWARRAPVQSAVPAAVAAVHHGAVNVVIGLHAPGHGPTQTWPFGSGLLCFLPLALLAVLDADHAEELVFRGYLQSNWPRGSPPGDLDGCALGAVRGAALCPVGMVTTRGSCHLGRAVRTGGGRPDGARHARPGHRACTRQQRQRHPVLVAPKGNFDGLALYTYPFSLPIAQMVSGLVPAVDMHACCSAAWLAARVLPCVADCNSRAPLISERRQQTGTKAA